jgi:hypothetical protein
VQESNQATGVSDGLLVPQHRLVWTLSFVLCSLRVLLNSEEFVWFADREDEEESASGSRNECEEVGIIDAEDVVEGERFGETELMDKGRHDFGVVLYHRAVRLESSTNWDRLRT